MADIVEDDEQKNLKSFMENYMGAINTEKPIEYWVTNTFSADWDTRDQWHDEINNFEKSTKQGQKSELSDEIAIFALLTNLKSLMIRAYRGSELVGEQYLAYDPIPGRQGGCIDLEEATGGRISSCIKFRYLKLSPFWYDKIFFSRPFILFFGSIFKHPFKGSNSLS